MNTNKKLYLYLILLSATSLIAIDADSNWEQDFGFPSMRTMRTRMNKMLEDMQHIEDELFSCFAKTDKPMAPQSNLVIDSNDNHVIIRLNNLQLRKEDADKIDIVRKGNVVSVVIIAQDKNKIEMKIDECSIMFTQRHEMNKEENKDEKITSSYMSTGMMHIKRPLPAKVELKDVRASYDDKTGTLTISFLKSEDEITQRIPVASIT